LAQGVKGVHVAGAVGDEVIGHCSGSHCCQNQESVEFLHVVDGNELLMNKKLSCKGNQMI
jgi:hypothetical protein